MASAVARAIWAGLEGEIAGPSGVFCVAVARLADAEATIEGLSAASSARSMLRDSPRPAVPAVERAMAVRAGWADGSPSPCVACATAGLSTAAGEAAMAAARTLRCGDPVAGASGAMLGALVVVAARECEVCATRELLLAAGVSSVG